MRTVLTDKKGARAYMSSKPHSTRFRVKLVGSEVKDVSHSGQLVQPVNGEVVFAHFLSEADYNKTIGIGEPRFSGPTEKKYVEQVDRLMCRLGLTRFVGQPYVSLFAITWETYKESVNRGQSHASGGHTALTLDLSKVETGTLFVFNGDVQNLSDTPEATRVHEFSADIKQVRDFVSLEYQQLPEDKRMRFIAEARLYAPLNRENIAAEYGRPEDAGDLIAEAVDELLSEDDRKVS
jgi:hypothetical protein